MGMVNINDLEEGMLVSNDVSNRHGNVLIKKGDLLTEKSIILLKSWGVTEVDIEGVDGNRLGEKEKKNLPPDVIDSIEREIKALFPVWEDNAFMDKLCGIVKKSRMKSAAEQVVGSDNETG